jgi:hypothetical protein
MKWWLRIVEEWGLAKATCVVHVLEFGQQTVDERRTELRSKLCPWTPLCYFPLIYRSRLSVSNACGSGLTVLNGLGYGSRHISLTKQKIGMTPFLLPNVEHSHSVKKNWNRVVPILWLSNQTHPLVPKGEPPPPHDPLSQMAPPSCHGGGLTPSPRVAHPPPRHAAWGTALLLHTTITTHPSPASYARSYADHLSLLMRHLHAATFSLESNDVPTTLYLAFASLQCQYDCSHHHSPPAFCSHTISGAALVS